MTFKDVQAETWEQAWQKIEEKIRALVGEHRYLVDSDRLSPEDIVDLRALLDGTARRAGYESALLRLSRCLERHHGRKVVMLIDEYDQPIHAAWVSGYGPQAIAFFRGLLTGGLKDNPHLFKAVVTGILRVSKESIFSDLNNLGVYTLLGRDFSTCFGFTEPEVAALFDRAGIGGRLESARTWYNGYVFGGTVIYNPWSVARPPRTSRRKPISGRGRTVCASDRGRSVKLPRIFGHLSCCEGRGRAVARETRSR